MRRIRMLVIAFAVGCGSAHSPPPIVASPAAREPPPSSAAAAPARPSPDATKVVGFAVYGGHWCPNKHTADVWSDGTVERVSNEVQGSFKLSPDELQFIREQLPVFELCKGDPAHEAKAPLAGMACGPVIDDAGMVTFSIYEGPFAGRGFTYMGNRYAPDEVLAFGRYLEKLTKPSDFKPKCN